MVQLLVQEASEIFWGAFFGPLFCLRNFGVQKGGSKVQTFAELNEPTPNFQPISSIRICQASGLVFIMTNPSLPCGR